MYVSTSAGFITLFLHTLAIILSIVVSTAAQKSDILQHFKVPLDMIILACRALTPILWICMSDEDLRKFAKKLISFNFISGQIHSVMQWCVDVIGTTPRASLGHWSHPQSTFLYVAMSVSVPHSMIFLCIVHFSCFTCNYYLLSSVQKQIKTLVESIIILPNFLQNKIVQSLRSFCELLRLGRQDRLYRTACIWFAFESCHNHCMHGGVPHVLR